MPPAGLPKLSDAAEQLYTLLLSATDDTELGLTRLFFQSDIKELILNPPASYTAKITNDTTPKKEEEGEDAEPTTTSSTTIPDKKLDPTLLRAAQSPTALLALIHELQTAALLRTNQARSDKALCWSLRPRTGAAQIRGLSNDERQLYEYVEASHNKGVWLKDLKKKEARGGGIPGPVVDRCMGRLEGMRLVKCVRNVRAPAQKTYMLFHLVPGDDVTGGSFFDGGDLDESLIEEVGNLIIFHVRMMSWVEAKMPRRVVKRERSPIAISDEEDADADDTSGPNGSPSPSRKRKRQTNDIEDSAPPASKHRSSHHASYHEDPVPVQLAHMPFTRTYPTATSIHAFVTTTDAIRATKAQQLTVAEIQGVVDVLVWDGKLERVGEGYRTVRGVKFRASGWGGGEGEGSSSEDDEGLSDEEEEDDEGVEVEVDGTVQVVGGGGGGGGRGRRKRAKEGNGLTQAPCGRCPVFDLCGSGGPINAASCVYFGEWLEGGGGG